LLSRNRDESRNGENERSQPSEYFEFYSFLLSTGEHELGATAGIIVFLSYWRRLCTPNCHQFPLTHYLFEKFGSVCPSEISSVDDYVFFAIENRKRSEFSQRSALENRPKSITWQPKNPTLQKLCRKGKS
jgi:hypothetical protein